MKWIRVRVMMFNATFNNVSDIYRGDSYIGGGNRSTRRKPKNLWQTLSHNIASSTWTGFELTTLVVIGTGCIGSCKSQPRRTHIYVNTYHYSRQYSSSLELKVDMRPHPILFLWSLLRKVSDNIPLMFRYTRFHSFVYLVCVIFW